MRISKKMRRIICLMLVVILTLSNSSLIVFAAEQQNDMIETIPETNTDIETESLADEASESLNDENGNESESILELNTNDAQLNNNESQDEEVDKNDEEVINEPDNAVEDHADVVVDENPIQNIQEEGLEEQSFADHVEGIDTDTVEPPKILIIDSEGNQQKYEITVTTEKYMDVRIAVWSEKNGQDDLIWYTANKVENAYTIEVKIKDHLSTGEYNVHAYGKDSNGQSSFIIGKRFQVEAPTVGKVVTESTSNGFQMTLSGVDSPSGISKVRAAIWCKADQSDLIWKTIEENEGVYKLEVNIADHQMLNGTYIVHFYADDGNGFSSYCGGASKKVEFENNKIIIQNKDKEQKTYTITLNVSEYTDVRFAVWSDENGQDDLKWYKAKSVGDTHTVEFNIQDHGSTGIYLVHIYGVKEGKSSYINGLRFKVEAPTHANIVSELTDEGFRISFDGITSPSDIKKVEVAVWCSRDQSDLRWTKVTPDGNGIYELDVDIENHNKMLGEYIVHIYAEDGNGIRNYCGGIRQKVGISAKKMSVSEIENGYEIIISDVVAYGTDKRVSIAVWSQKNGQDDLNWYEAKKEENDFVVFVPAANMKDGGVYLAHAYVYDTNGKQTYLCGTSFYVNFFIQVGEAENGKVNVTISAVDGTVESNDFSAQVWTKEDQSDLVIVYSKRTEQDSFSIEVPLADFALYSGDYFINIYRKQENGIQKLVKELRKNIVFKTGTVAPVDASANNMKYTVTLKNADLKGVEDKVGFYVWSENEGQDDLVLYTAKKTGSDYQVDVPISNHNDTGKYVVHIYAYLKNGTRKFLGGLTFNVDALPVSKLEVISVDGKKGIVEICEQLGSIGYKVSKVSLGVWNTCKNGSVVWYDMVETSEGQYTATVDVKNHEYKFGSYNAHAYVTDNEGNRKYYNGISFSIAPDNIVTYQKTDSANGKVIIYGANVNGKALDSIEMATWSSDGNQDDVKWTEAKKDEAGAYSVDIRRGDYARSGEYITHIYGYIDGKSYFLGGIAYVLYKTGEFDEYAQMVMHKIIYAVETGGQIYGNSLYDCFCPAYNLTSKETAITIGAAGWFATEAQKLLKLIREENPILFASLDTEGISEDLDHEDWTTYGGDGNGNATILRGSPKAKCIQKLISTSVGMKVQDRLVDQQMIKYVSEAKALGVTDLKGQMFCANVRHLGGYSAMKRIITDCKNDGLSFTMGNIYTSMRNHTTNKNGNTVGANKYVTRHTKVMSWIDKYIV